MELVAYAGRAVARLKSRGIQNTARYAAYIVKERAIASAIDLRFGGRLCRTNLDETIYTAGHHWMEHSPYHILKDIFAKVPVGRDDVLVDVGCGEGRVINFWLSQGFKNRIVGIEAVEAVATRARERYGKYANVLIIHGDAVENVPRFGTIFFLYSPFSLELMARFEEKVRSMGPMIVYYHNLYMEPFLANGWKVDQIAPKGRIYEFQAALITRPAQA